MTVYVLRASDEYADCYFIEECKTREEAINKIEPYFNYKFIEGSELRLQLTEKE